MNDNNTVERYNCTKCGYTNIWTHDEIMQRGMEVVYCGDTEVVYTLRCKNPVGCDQRMRVAVRGQKG